MADQTFQIGTGETYTTIQAWEDASDVSTGFWKGELKDTTAYSEVIISGVTGTPTISNYVWLTAAAGNKHSGVAGITHARIEGDPTASALVTISDSFTRVDHLEIKLTGTGSSDECIRVTSGVTGALISRNIIYSTGTGSSQDGIYTGNWSCDGSIDHNIIYGFERGGIHLQNYNGVNTQTWNIDFCTLYNNGSGTNDANLLVDSDNASAVMNINVYNTAGASGNTDYLEATGSGTINWTGTHNASSDASLTTIGLTTSAQESLTVTATTQSTGSYMVFNNITATTENLLLLDDAGGNLLYGNGVDRSASEPDSRQDFSIDIIGNTRSTTSPAPDIGAHEYTPAGSGITINPAAGSISFTGQTADVAADAILTPVNGALSVTGQDVATAFGNNLVPDQGVIIMTGQDVSVFTVTSINPAAGTLSFAGQTVSLTELRVVAPDAATLSMAGQGVTIDAIFVESKKTGLVYGLTGPLVADLLKELL